MKEGKQPMANEDACVATFASHDEAEKAVKALEQAGFDMKKLSIVGKDYHSEEHVVGYYNAGDRMKAWGKLGGFWGGLWGILARSSAQRRGAKKEGQDQAIHCPLGDCRQSPRGAAPAVG
jgi:hypothetical protein